MKLRALLLVFILAGLSATSSAATTDLVDEEQISSVEERRILVSIEDEYTKLDEREAKIAEREMQLKTLEGEVDKKLAAMQTLRDELVKLLDRKTAEEGERIGELSRIYEKMAPQKAAYLVKQLDRQLAV